MEPGYDMVILGWWREEMGLAYYLKDDHSIGDWQVSFTKLPSRVALQRSPDEFPEAMSIRSPCTRSNGMR